MKHIILGTAHLESTPGKRSPDGKFREYKYSREIIQTIYAVLKDMNYDVYIDIPEDDLKLNQNQELKKRVSIVNNLCNKFGASNCIYVSIHVNAAGMGDKWMNATGWCAYTSRGNTKADKLAECLYKSAKDNLKGKLIRENKSDGDSDLESNFYVLKNTKCPAVLTENFF
jgi:N-acetylmuramoyl-L-alanine amidase